MRCRPAQQSSSRHSSRCCTFVQVMPPALKPHRLPCTQECLPGSCPAAQAQPAQVHGELDALARVHAGLRAGQATLTRTACFTQKSVAKGVELDPHECSLSPTGTAAAVSWTSAVDPDSDADEWAEPIDIQGVQVIHVRPGSKWPSARPGRASPRKFLSAEHAWTDSGRFCTLYAEGQHWEEQCVKVQVRLWPAEEPRVTGSCRQRVSRGCSVAVALSAPGRW